MTFRPYPLSTGFIVFTWFCDFKPDLCVCLYFLYNFQKLYFISYIPQFLKLDALVVPSLQQDWSHYLLFRLKLLDWEDLGCFLCLALNFSAWHRTIPFQLLYTCKYFISYIPQFLKLDALAVPSLQQDWSQFLLFRLKLLAFSRSRFCNIKLTGKIEATLDVICDTLTNRCCTFSRRLRELRESYVNKITSHPEEASHATN